MNFFLAISLSIDKKLILKKIKKTNELEIEKIKLNNVNQLRFCCVFCFYFYICNIAWNIMKGTPIFLSMSCCCYYYYYYKTFSSCTVICKGRHLLESIRECSHFKSRCIWNESEWTCNKFSLVDLCAVSFSGFAFI